MPVNTNMTTNGSAALRIQYNEFTICVQSGAMHGPVEFGTKLAETAVCLVKSANFTDMED